MFGRKALKTSLSSTRYLLRGSSGFAEQGNSSTERWNSPHLPDRIFSKMLHGDGIRNFYKVLQICGILHLLSYKKGPGQISVFSGQQHLSTILGRGILTKNKWNGGFQQKITDFYLPLTTPTSRFEIFSHHQRNLKKL